MSTSSTPSDLEDDEIFNGRSSTKVRKNTCFSSRRYSEREEDEEERGIEQERSRLSKTHPKEARQSQRNAANARERARMRVLSKAFSRLKTSLPWVPADTKLSKLDTLRLASSYICHLRQILQEDRLENSCAHPVSLTWPFMSSGRSEEDISSALRLCGATA
ncbi:PREDICTED: musculin isoform X1 [Cyprinodon variegatus]|uniref:musculin isoform X1 n=1 Tax=Cyprinodon variegatus TaxID=28743 RepID=UPI000742CD2C|nr:PREDICTED: musculin isoform X1 [Cyprinodon variegatus]